MMANGTEAVERAAHHGPGRFGLQVQCHQLPPGGLNVNDPATVIYEVENGRLK